jgi:light-regulated signal transduction histidine kinase (bacteriophytochrome)
MEANILVVDDTPENLRLLMGILAEQGYRVRPVPSGTRALSTVQIELPDLILLDIKMPDMSGYEVCEQLKADDRTRDIPIIFLSALNKVEDKVKGFEVGGVDYITKPFQVEEVLARVKTHLTLQHMRKALEQKNVEFEAVNKELRDFAYIVSHDLKAPLRGITQLVHWLVQDYANAFDEKGQEMTELLCHRVKRMGHLIDGILEYSRAGRIEETHEQIDLNTLVNDVIEMITPPESMQIAVENDLPTVFGDRTRLEQVFQNLFSNAVKFMDKPEGKITIGCLDDGAFWKFSVADNGPGIDEKDHEKIFQIFQILASSDEQESTGVGLAIVKKIVEFYGGEIWVESTVGEGSTFLFTLSKKRTKLPVAQ